MQLRLIKLPQKQQLTLQIQLMLSHSIQPKQLIQTVTVLVIMQILMMTATDTLTLMKQLTVVKVMIH